MSVSTSGCQNATLWGARTDTADQASQGQMRLLRGSIQIRKLVAPRS